LDEEVETRTPRLITKRGGPDSLTNLTGGRAVLARPGDLDRRDARV
jgi:hypothetical protein